MIYDISYLENHGPLSWTPASQTAEVPVRRTFPRAILSLLSKRAGTSNRVIWSARSRPCATSSSFCLMFLNYVWNNQKPKEKCVYIYIHTCNQLELLMYYFHLIVANDLSWFIRIIIAIHKKKLNRIDIWKWLEIARKKLHSNTMLARICDTNLRVCQITIGNSFHIWTDLLLLRLAWECSAENMLSCWIMYPFHIVPYYYIILHHFTS